MLNVKATLTQTIKSFLLYWIFILNSDDICFWWKSANTFYSKAICFASVPVSSELPFVQFDISCFFKISFMTKEIYFKDTIPIATTKIIFRRNFVIEKGRWRKWIVRTNSSEIQNLEDYFLLSGQSSQQERTLCRFHDPPPFPAQIYVCVVVIT